jgi:hypothetical protein
VSVKATTSESPVYYNWHIGWTADNRAMLSVYREDLIEIDLSTLRGRTLPFTAREDAR